MWQQQRQHQQAPKAGKRASSSSSSSTKATMSSALHHSNHQQFCLKWNSFHANMSDVFQTMLVHESLVDVTLACEGASIKAHKMILAACSPYFQNLFLANPCKHPIVILKDVKFTDLKSIIDFIYSGEVNIPQEQLGSLLKTAETLKIKGLADAEKSLPSPLVYKSSNNLAASLVAGGGGAATVSVANYNNFRFAKKRKRQRIIYGTGGSGGGGGGSIIVNSAAAAAAAAAAAVNNNNNPSAINNNNSNGSAGTTPTSNGTSASNILTKTYSKLVSGGNSPASASPGSGKVKLVALPVASSTPTKVERNSVASAKGNTSANETNGTGDSSDEDARPPNRTNSSTAAFEGEAEVEEEFEPTKLLEQSMSEENPGMDYSPDNNGNDMQSIKEDDGEDSKFMDDDMYNDLVVPAGYEMIGNGSNGSSNAVAQSNRTIEEYEALLTEIQEKNLTTCPICSKEFIKKSKLIRHYHTHFSDFRPKFSCVFCGKLFTTQDWCKRHALNCQLKHYQHLSTVQPIDLYPD